MVGWNVFHGHDRGSGDNMATLFVTSAYHTHYTLITQRHLTPESILPTSYSMLWLFLLSLEESYFLTNLSH